MNFLILGPEKKGFLRMVKISTSKRRYFKIFRLKRKLQVVSWPIISISIVGHGVKIFPICIHEMKYF